MKCLNCEGNLLSLNESFICDKCGIMYKLENDKLIGLTCPKCSGEMIDGKCNYCEKEVILEDEEEELILYCPDCGEVLDLDGKCKACGNKIDITFEE